MELERLAGRVGVVSRKGKPSFSLPVSADEAEALFHEYERCAVTQGIALIAACEVKVVRREWNRLSRTGGHPRSMDELLEDWCIERVSAQFLTWLEGHLPLESPGERLEQIRILIAAVRDQLRGERLDIIQELRRNPSGATVRRRRKVDKRPTRVILDEPLLAAAENER